MWGPLGKVLLVCIVIARPPRRPGRSAPRTPPLCAASSSCCSALHMTHQVEQLSAGHTPGDVVTMSRGWASVTEELEVGLNAVAAPVRKANSQFIAALSVSGPSYRLAVEKFGEVADKTIAAADAISRRLGWIGPCRA